MEFCTTESVVSFTANNSILGTRLRITSTNLGPSSSAVAIHLHFLKNRNFHFININELCNILKFSMWITFIINLNNILILPSSLSNNRHSIYVFLQKNHISEKLWTVLIDVENTSLAEFIEVFTLSSECQLILKFIFTLLNFVVFMFQNIFIKKIIQNFGIIMFQKKLRKIEPVNW